MRTFVSHHRSQVAMILVVIVLIVVGGLWWTKTLAFTATAFVQSSIAPVQTPDGSTSQYFISDVTPPDEVPVFSERLAQNLGGNASDYESDLTITASDTHGLAVTAKGRTPNAAKHWPQTRPKLSERSSTKSKHQT